METQPIFVLTNAIKEGINPETGEPRFFEVHVIQKNGEDYITFAEGAVTKEEAQVAVDTLNKTVADDRRKAIITEVMKAEAQLNEQIKKARQAGLVVKIDFPEAAGRLANIEGVAPVGKYISVVIIQTPLH